MKKKENLTKKSDNSSEEEESKSQDEGSVQKVQRMDKQDISLKNLQKQNEFINHNKDTIVDTALEKAKPSDYDEKQKKAEKLLNAINKIDPEVKARLTTQEEIEFYAHCSMYLDENTNKSYEEILNYINEHKNIEDLPAHYLNQLLTNNIMYSIISELDVDNNRLDILNALLLPVTSIYKICADHNIVLHSLTTPNNSLSTKDVIHQDIELISNTSLAGNVINFIDDYA